MAEILHHPRCHPNFEIMGVAGGSIKDAIVLDMAGGAGFQPSTVPHHCLGDNYSINLCNFYNDNGHWI